MNVALAQTDHVKRRIERHLSLLSHVCNNNIHLSPFVQATPFLSSFFRAQAKFLLFHHLLPLLEV